MTEPIIFQDVTLTVKEETALYAPKGKGVGGFKAGGGGLGADGMFVPRTAASRPRAGIGSKKHPGLGLVSSSARADKDGDMDMASTSAGAGADGAAQPAKKNQNAFRQMLLGGK